MKGRKHIHHSKKFQRFTIGELRKMPFGKILRLFLRDVSATYRKRMLRGRKKKNTVIDRTKILPGSSVSLDEKSSYFVNELSTQVQVYSATSETRNLSSQVSGEVVNPIREFTGSIKLPDGDVKRIDSSSKLPTEHSNGVKRKRGRPRKNN